MAKLSSICVKEWDDQRTTKPHVLPIYATSSFAFDDIDQGMRIFQKKEKGHVYGRYGNPTIDTVASKIAALETHGLDIDAHAIMFSSGMAAIHCLISAHLKPGEKILTQGNLYGGTTEQFKKVFGSLGIGLVLTDLNNLSIVEEKLASDQSIKLVYFETPANPTLACVDIQGLSTLASRFQCISAIDNTFPTPYLQQPFKFGVDYIVHSTTKYLNGHGNSIAGILIGRDKEMMQTKVWEMMKLIGSNCNPFDAWLTHNGLKTLAVRMDKHCQNAMEVARFLDAHSSVLKVNYIGLESHPHHKIAKNQMSDFGGMLSFELNGGLEAGIEMMRKIKFCTLAPTLGDVDTLILHPASMSHINIDKEIRLRNGITDGLIRVSVGIEDAEDIINDLDQAL
jgi:methionine-gamma-lyase